MHQFTKRSTENKHTYIHTLDSFYPGHNKKKRAKILRDLEEAPPPTNELSGLFWQER